MVIHLPGGSLEAMAKVVRSVPAEDGMSRVGLTFLWQDEG
jgi:hypothetical protein